MKKYKVYRSLGDLDKNIKKHELVAVEYAEDIEAATEALIKAVEDDLASSPEYVGCRTGAYAPTFVSLSRRTTRYDYEMTGVVYPKFGPKNTVIDFGIIEEDVTDGYD